ncbi:hypothetical protein GP486_002657 [Trichoglossum hirsutum]|uniref:3'(2'),5'-bisphosphate nucleotidase n=1 Tax=Trichoglossum hirsutum TaxID=265104 RepID=A0A9P8RRH8_9PEZI|nr:hypothetical protein GP486_002657 [Trichoglossum hirsutum]
MAAPYSRERLTKDDKTPVTIADYGSQALIINAIRHNFPDDAFIGEEDATALRSDRHLCDRVWELVSSTHLGDKNDEELLSTMSSPAEMLNAIDLGMSPSGRKGRVWVLDPIDGTAEFICGGQYAVSLALLEDGQQRVGVLGCPCLSADATNMFGGPTETQEPGNILSAVSGQGATVRPMSRGALLPSRQLTALRDAPLSSRLRFVDCAKSRSSAVEKHAATARALGAPWPASDIVSLQLKWAALATGISDALLRLPRRNSKRDWIWDHAGGVLIAEEVGFRITDANGKAIDFGAGRRLEENFGWVVAHPEVHGEVLKRVTEIYQANPAL